MSKFQQKAEAQTKQIIGQMLGDELLVEEGNRAAARSDGAGARRHDQDGNDQGIVRDERGQRSSPATSERAQRVSRVDRGGDPPGKEKRVSSFWGARRAHQI